MDIINNKDKIVKKDHELIENSNVIKKYDENVILSEDVNIPGPAVNYNANNSNTIDLEIINNEKYILTLLHDNYNQNPTAVNKSIFAQQAIIVKQTIEMVEAKIFFENNLNLSTSNPYSKIQYYHSRFLLSRYKNDFARLKLDSDKQNLTYNHEVLGASAAFNMESKFYLNYLSNFNSNSNYIEFVKAAAILNTNANYLQNVAYDSSYTIKKIKPDILYINELKTDNTKEIVATKSRYVESYYKEYDSSIIDLTGTGDDNIYETNNVCKQNSLNSPQKAANSIPNQIAFKHNSEDAIFERSDSITISLESDFEIDSDTENKNIPADFETFSDVEEDSDDDENFHLPNSKKVRKNSFLGTKKTVKVVDPIVLKPNQPKNVKNLAKILTYNKFAVDNSMAGAGKTIMSLAVCQKIDSAASSGVGVIVICPTSTMSEWKRQLILKGFPDKIPLVINGKAKSIDNTVISYESLRSKGTSTNNLPKGLCKHKLLKFRVINKNSANKGKQEKTTSFLPSSYLNALVKQKIVFIFDEFHRMKNAHSLQHVACSIITKKVCNGVESNLSRILFLSATPFDKAIQVVHFLNAVNIIPNRLLVGPPFDIKPAKYGMGEFLDLCYKIDPASSSRIINLRRGIPSKETESLEILLEKLPGEKLVACELVVAMYSKILSKYFVSAAPSYKLPFDLDVGDGYFNISNTNGIKLYKAIKGLEQTVCQIKYEKIIDFTDLTLHFMAIENAKAEIFARKVHQYLLADPNCKVMCFLNYHSTMTAIHNFLDSIGIENTYISKGTSVHDRELQIKPFMENNLKCRVLIGNTSVLGCGINLDDIDGRFPRYCLISPSYFYMTLHQASYRCYRANTKSSPTVRYVYGKVSNLDSKVDQTDLIEARLLNSMASKTAVMRSIVMQQLEVQENVKFPGQHKIHREASEYREDELALYSKCCVESITPTDADADFQELEDNEAKYIEEIEHKNLAEAVSQMDDNVADERITILN